MIVDLSLAFTAGLLGAAHCIGMCAGIAGGFFARCAPAGARTFIVYHGLRLMTYTLLGVGGALIGRTLVQSGWIGKAQGLLLILTGLVVIFFATRLALPARSDRAVTAFPLKRSGRWLPAAGGLLNGLVPCSLVFSVALKATATGNPIHAAALMASFGLGTLPATVGMSAVAASLARVDRFALRRITGATIAVLGLWTVYEGVVFYDVMRGLANW